MSQTNKLRTVLIELMDALTDYRDAQNGKSTKTPQEADVELQAAYARAWAILYI